MFEEQFETGEVNHAEEVFDVVFVASDEPPRNCANVSALARELEIDRAMLYHWQRLAGEQGTDATATSPVRELRKQVRDLKRLLPEGESIRRALPRVDWKGTDLRAGPVPVGEWV